MIRRKKKESESACANARKVGPGILSDVLIKVIVTEKNRKLSFTAFVYLFFCANSDTVCIFVLTLVQLLAALVFSVRATLHITLYCSGEQSTDCR